MSRKFKIPFFTFVIIFSVIIGAFCFITITAQAETIQWTGNLASLRYNMPSSKSYDVLYSCSGGPADLNVFVKTQLNDKQATTSVETFIPSGNPSTGTSPIYSVVRSVNGVSVKTKVSSITSYTKGTSSTYYGGTATTDKLSIFYRVGKTEHYTNVDYFDTAASIDFFGNICYE